MPLAAYFIENLGRAVQQNAVMDQDVAFPSHGLNSQRRPDHPTPIFLFDDDLIAGLQAPLGKQGVR